MSPFYPQTSSLKAWGLETKDDETGMGWESVEMGVVHVARHEHEHECRQKSVITR